ncbi:helix-turn-helix transcriptional regulator [Pseudoflavitalea sp. G-6-1-2]|uniref:helix-turn-helix domain-containing protein n=1 Tax=Pseudoflavitalea sp. G-6-1-2 TaxID=2728841 RepID=UPI00146DCCF0|nr:AraC family transcriptional regulator [Pseudoflavitalea sp. G-6-1-2]NML23563.1 helix-turn-helix transcriptional regulator [Pseudoflavitalea sp. G-6-1-2]
MSITEFPPVQAATDDRTFLTADGSIFAKHKTENKKNTKTVFLTRDTLVFILKGEKHLHIDNEKVEVSSQEIIFLKKGIYAMAEYFEEGLNFEAILLFLTPSIVQEVIAEYKITLPSTVSDSHYLKLPSNETIDGFKKQLLQYFTNNTLKDKGILLLKQKEILLYILKTIPFAKTAPFWASLTSAESADISRIVEKFLFQKLSVEQYAKLCNRSLSSFKRDFTSLYQSSPKKWITQKRLEHARLLLNNTDTRISEISDQCGFEATSYFTKLFKRAYNITPTEFRANRYTE